MAKHIESNVKKVWSEFIKVDFNDLLQQDYSEIHMKKNNSTVLFNYMKKELIPTVEEFHEYFCLQLRTLIAILLQKDASFKQKFGSTEIFKKMVNILTNISEKNYNGHFEKSIWF